MSPGPWLVLAAALLVVCFIMLTPAFSRLMSRTFPNDPFASLDAPGANISSPIHLSAPRLPILRKGDEGQGRLSRYRIVDDTKILFIPRHFSVFYDQGWPCAPVQGIITVVSNGVDARIISPGPKLPRPLELILDIALFPVVWLQRKVLKAQVADVISVITENASHNNALQLTKPAQAMELRS